MNFVNEYIKYLVKSQGRHGIHSPFVYDFVDQCLKIELDSPFKKELSALKLALKKNSSTIEIEDFGAGSKRLTKMRSIQSIYKTAACKGVYANLLFQLSKHYKPQNILELGTSLGIGTIHLAHGNPTATVVTIDACQKTLEVAKANFTKMNIQNISTFGLQFEPYLTNEIKPIFDLVYIDGHHQGFALKKYLKLLEQNTHENTIFVLDDIRWSNDMFESWKEIISADTYHLTMDLFRMGIIIRRPQQVKEHFVIKLKNVLSGF